MLKNTFYHLTIIVCVVQVGFWSFPFRVFSFVPEKDLMEKSYFSQNETNEINVVFLRKKMGLFFRNVRSLWTNIQEFYRIL